MAPQQSELSKEIALLHQQVQMLDRCINGNGKPGLEERLMGLLKTMRKEIDVSINQVTRHGNKNAEQGDMDVLEAVKRETLERERQHNENKELAAQREREREKRDEEAKEERKATKASVDRLTLVVTGFGMAIGIIETLEKFGIIHFKG